MSVESGEIIDLGTLAPGLVPLGGGRWHVSVWAPEAQGVSLHFLSPDRVIPLERGPRGVHRAVVDKIASGARYRFRLGDEELPDPASRHQPEGVRGPSAAF